MSSVRTDADGAVFVITLDRPRRRNAIDGSLAVELAAAFAELDHRDSLAVGVVTGAQGTFCAGMDLAAWGGRAPADAAAALDAIVRARPQKPLIAAIEGFAVGGGLELALTCDLIVAARDAQLGLPEVRLGLVPSGGGLLRLPGRVPPSAALELGLTGAMVDGRRLHALGLVNRATDPGGALPAARALAAQIAANGPEAVVASKRLLWRALRHHDDAVAWDEQTAVCERVNASPDAREGVQAFLEKRPPRFGTGAT